MSPVVIFLVATAISMAASCEAKVFTVGGESEWTSINITADFYSKWAAAQDFSAGDTLLFMYYSNYHNVVRVSSRNFHTCNATEALSVWTTGNDSFRIPRPGNFYFVCAMPGHCEAGQKLAVQVSGSPSPVLPPANSPSPSSRGSDSASSAVALWKLGVAAAFAVLSV